MVLIQLLRVRSLQLTCRPRPQALCSIAIRNGACALQRVHSPRDRRNHDTINATYAHISINIFIMICPIFSQQSQVTNRMMVNARMWTDHLWILCQPCALLCWPWHAWISKRCWFAKRESSLSSAAERWKEDDDEENTVFDNTATRQKGTRNTRV